MSEELGYREEHLENIINIYLDGEVDIYSAPSFKEKIYSTAESSEVDLKVYCDKLRYIDSTGLGIFVGALKRVKQKQKDIYLSGLKENIKKLFTITGLDKVFKIEE